MVSIYGLHHFLWLQVWSTCPPNLQKIRYLEKINLWSTSILMVSMFDLHHAILCCFCYFLPFSSFIILVLSQFFITFLHCLFFCSCFLPLLLLLWSKRSKRKKERRGGERKNERKKAREREREREKARKKEKEKQRKKLRNFGKMFLH